MTFAPFHTFTLFFSLLFGAGDPDCGYGDRAPCAKSEGSAWELVSRRTTLKRSYEVWRDRAASPPLLWSDVLDTRYVHDCFDNECAGFPFKYVSQMAEGSLSERACGPNSKALREAAPGMADRSFHLPTAKEYLESFRNGMRETLPNMKGFLFWTAGTQHSGGGMVADLFDGSRGTLSHGARYWRYSVRCVSRE